VDFESFDFITGARKVKAIADWECDAVKRTELAPAQRQNSSFALTTPPISSPVCLFERQIGNRQLAIGNGSFPIS
jgi:hypothetical protein